jgi:DNA-binding PadR family transcriptional regulator
MGQGLPVTSYALLGLLTFGDELTGYELKQRADNTLRFYWSSPAMSQVYSELGRLADHHLVEPVSTDEDGGRPTTRYRITRQGHEELRGWMEDEPAGFPVLKHPVALRLLIGHLLDPAGAAQLLRDYLDDLDRQRKDLDDVRESLRGRDGPGEPFRYPALVADWGLAYYDSEGRIARDILGRLESDG